MRKSIDLNCIGSATLDISLLLPPSSLYRNLYCPSLTIVTHCLLISITVCSANSRDFQTMLLELHFASESCHTTSALAASLGSHQIQGCNILLLCCSWPCPSLCELLSAYQPGRSVISAYVGFLTVPPMRLEKFSSHFFLFLFSVLRMPCHCLSIQ